VALSCAPLLFLKISMNFITSFPKYSDGEVNKALMRELTQGLELKKQWENRRELQAAEEAKQSRGMKEIAGLGRHVASIPSWEFYRLKDKYGHAEIHSKEFLKDFQKRFPHLSPNKI